MKKVFKRISLLALSALMVGTASVSLASCGDDDDTTISVYVFAGTDDQETNSDLVATWAEEYAQKLIDAGVKEEGFTITTDCTFESDTTKYFQALTNTFTSGNTPDVFYVSPKYVKTWSKLGRIVELSQYIDFSETNYDPSGVFSSALGLYAYDGTNVGLATTYDATTKTFVNSAGNETGIYAFPKDYSTFGLGYNANFFTEEMQTKYENSSAAALGDVASDGKSVIRTAATGADSAGVINVGIPTTYYPYNFYVYNSYTEALAAGDPVAAASDANNGYTVTIPGYPGETFTKASDGSESYDSTIGYITYTYAEYSAVTWAITYYYNKYETSHATVYGNDQYEGTLYLLPWLAGNDANYINQFTSSNGDDPYTSVESGTYTDESGNTINYGIDNEEFIETYGAFCAYGSDWNGNAYYAGDGMLASGYTSFKEGNVLFYGVGTWDAAGFNGVDLDTLTYRVMPEPVSEDYALYSRVKDAYYNEQIYTNGGKSTSTSVPASYSDAEIEANQLTRQDEWAGRIDSVGYGVSGLLESSKSDWKLEACVDLAAALTLGEDGQLQLTYSGSQLPNYEDMMLDYVYGIGTFADMISPDDSQWETYYALAAELVSQDDRSTTLSAYMSANHPDMKYNERYGDYTLKKISTSIRAFLCLNMISLDYNSRNLFARMVSGTNGVSDSCSYTYDSSWIDTFSNSKAACLIAWTQKDAGSYAKVSTTWVNESTLCTPAVYCQHFVTTVQTALDTSVANEKEALS